MLHRKTLAREVILLYKAECWWKTLCKSLFMISLSKRLLNPTFGRGFIVVALAAVIATRSACATAITIDLSNSRGVAWDVAASFDDLNGTQLIGETLSLDFRWANANFARLFTITSDSFNASIKLSTNGSGPKDYLQGTGYLVDGSGLAIPGFGITGVASGTDLMKILLYPLWKDENGTPNDNLARPLDFYGLHLDLTLPDLSDPSIQVTGGTFGLSSDPDGVFGIGPGIPRDIVPDLGSTLLFLGIGTAAIQGMRIRLS